MSKTEVNDLDHEVGRMLDQYPEILALVKRKASVRVRVGNDTTAIALSHSVGERAAWLELLSMKNRSDRQIAEATNIRSEK